MPFPRFSTPRRSLAFAAFAAIVALVVGVTGFESSAHGHVPAVDGWHDTTPHGATAHDDGLSSCSICRLAHETSSGPISPGTVAAPLARFSSKPAARRSFALSTPSRRNRSRAPPTAGSC